MATDRVIIATMKIHGKGRVQIPKEVRGILGVTDGDRVYFVQNSSRRIFLEKAPTLKKRRPGKYRVTGRE